MINAYEYKGDVSVQIQDGESAGMEYYITFFPWGEDCGFQKCYYGFVNNYTMENEETQENEVFEGFGNKLLSEQPIFRLGSNSREDYSIKYSQDLDDGWKDIIEISC